MTAKLEYVYLKLELLLTLFVILHHNARLFHFSCFTIDIGLRISVFKTNNDSILLIN